MSKLTKRKRKPRIDLEGEVWTRADTPNPIYMVSNLGRVWNMHTGSILKQIDSYTPNMLTVCVRLYDDKKGNINMRVAQLVARAFLAVDPEGRKFVDFTNGDWRDCRAANLKWAKGKQGRPISKKMDAEVVRLSAEGLALRTISQRLGLSISSASKALKRLREEASK